MEFKNMANMASNGQRLKIVKQIPFEFYGLIFLLYQTDQDKLVVPIQNLCKVLGLNYGNQCRRVKNHEILSGHLYQVRPRVSPKNGPAQERDWLCLSLECLPYWLGWIDVRGTGKRAHDKIAKYQRDALEALWLKDCFEILPDTLDVREEARSAMVRR
jgi:hypothetical protein